MARHPFPVVLSAPSGTGKTTLAHLLVDSMSNLQISVSHTTRPIRGNEQEGVDYNFVSQKEFSDKLARNAFIEHATVHGHSYGSSAEWTSKTLKEGTDVLYDIDVQGGIQIKDRFPNAVLIFILPPTMEILKKRLVGRGTDSKSRIEKRLEASKEEIKLGLARYDYVINNEKLDRALFDLTAIVRTHRLLGFDRSKIQKRLLGE